MFKCDSARAAQQAVEDRRPRLVVTCAASLSPVVKYHGLARRYLLPPRFLMRPLLNGGTLGGRKQDTGLGLFAFRIRFDSELPSEETFRAELIRQAGSDLGLDGFEIKNNLILITANLEPVTRPYAIKVLLDLGGVYVDFATREPRDPRLPPYTLKPWLTWPWWKRAYIHACFHLALLSTLCPRVAARGLELGPTNILPVHALLRAIANAAQQSVDDRRPHHVSTWAVPPLARGDVPRARSSIPASFAFRSAAAA